MPYFYLKDSLFDLTNPYMRNDVYLFNQSRPLRRYTHGRINLQQSSIAMGQTGLHSYVCSQGGDGPVLLGGGLPRQRPVGKFRPMELTAVCSWPKRGFKSMFWRKEGLGCAWSTFPRTCCAWVNTSPTFNQDTWRELASPSTTPGHEIHDDDDEFNQITTFDKATWW